MRADTLRRVAAFLILAAVWAAPSARAQFSAQQTYVASSSGGSNAFIVVVPNVTSSADLLGVPIRVLMSAGSSSASTLQINSPSGSTIVAATAISKLTLGGLQALNGSEIAAGQISTFMWDGTVFELVEPTLSTTTVQAQSGFVAPVNLSLSCTTSANALTCQMLAASIAAAPTAVNPVYVPFRDTSTPTGDPVWRTIIALVSTTISGGNTMGCVSGSPCRLWITAIDNAGTVVLGLSNQSSTSQIFPLNEGILQATGTGTGGGNTAGTIFTSVSLLSGKAVRIIGYVEWTVLTVAGNWTTPNFVQLFGPGIKKPGDVMQTIVGQNAVQKDVASSTFTATNLTANITPTSAANLIRVTASGTIRASSEATAVQAKLLRTAGTTLFGSLCVANTTATSSTLQTPCTSIGLDAPGSTAQQTYSAAIASSNNSNTVSWSQSSANSVIVIEEIMGALDPPANDNADARMTG